MRLLNLAGGLSSHRQPLCLCRGALPTRAVTVVVSFLTVWVLQGCLMLQTPGEDLTRERVTAPEEFRSLYFVREADVSHRWLQRLGDEQLTNLVEEAIAHNYDLYQAAAVRDQVLAAVRLARSTMLPRLDGLATLERDEDSRRAEELLTIEAAVSWEADLWGRLRAGRLAAHEDAVATAFEYEYLRQSLAALVAEAWFLAVAARHQIAIDLDRVESEQATASVAASRAEAGAGEPIDNDFAQANLAFARDELSASEFAYEELVRSLELLLGRYPGATLLVVESFPEIPTMPAAGYPAELLERRPDLIAAEARVAAAFHRAQASRLARLPRLRLTGSAGVELDPARGIWTLAADLLAPLFTGGEISAQIDIATAQQKAAMAAYVYTALEAFREVESALSSQLHLRRRSRELGVAVDRLATANRRAQARYEAGVMTIFELNQVRQNYYRAQAQHVNVQLERLRQWVNLHLAIGGSYDEGYGSLESLPSDIADRAWPGPDTEADASDKEAVDE